MTQKVIKTGNSLAITIPNKFVKIMSVKNGDVVRVEKRPDKGTLVVYFQGFHQLAISDSIFHAAKKIK